MRWCLLLLLLVTAEACKVDKSTVKNCLLQHDDGDGTIHLNEVNAILDNALHWWEKAVYPRSWIISLLQKDCNIPLNFGRKTCFESCMYRESVYYRLCN